MSVQSRIDAMHADNTVIMNPASRPAAVLDAVLATTGISLSAGEKQVVLLFKTREQIIIRYATQAG